MSSNKPIFDPMIYDALLELATRIGGRYLAWAREASNESTAQYWRSKGRELRIAVWAVDSRDEAAVQTKRQELRELWRSMPVDAPQLTA